MLSSTSQIRIQVDEARVDILRYLRRRWVNVRQESGFDQLEGWALKEISHGKFAKIFISCVTEFSLDHCRT